MKPGGAAYGAVENGVIAVTGRRISWLGPADAMPAGLPAGAAETLDAAGGWITPGLIDAHTHLVFGGSRVGELEMRLGGASYEQIARSGGGILSTVDATRAATDEELERTARSRLAALASAGVTTVEIKSGYGLDVEHELRMLRVARALGEALPVTVRTTLLGAHALPREYASDRDAYVRLVCERMIPSAVREDLADAVDAFCEGIAFSAEECSRVFEAAAAHGLPVRLHADQLGDSGGAALAARHRARSADHLEHASENGVRAMAEAGTAAVLLPGAFYFLRERTVPPVAGFREHGVPMVVATDLNPGSSPLTSPLLAMNMACVLFGLTPDEALAGMTRNAAHVLGMGGERGVLEVGAAADLVVWDVEQPGELAYWMGSNPCVAVVRAGRVVRSGRAGAPLA
jgi:imidazolonepropionase